MKVIRWVVLLLLLVSVGTAQAGHYRLPIAGFIDGDVNVHLADAGVTTTLALLQEVTTAAKRKKLSGKSGLKREQVEALARQVDFLRIDDVGPTMARLLIAAGVADTRALKNEAAAPLLTRMAAANQANKIAGVLPPEALVASWVAAAQRLPQVIEGLP